MRDGIGEGEKTNPESIVELLKHMAKAMMISRKDQLAGKPTKDKIHDRISHDLPINSRVAIAIVDDPYSSVGEKITVVRSVRDDPLAGMLSRGQIDQAQFAAGREWQRYAEDCEIGSIQAIDTTKEAVDGGRMREPITDRQIIAFKAIAESRQALGHEGNRLVFDILALRVTIRQAAESRGRFTQWGWKATGREFRACLEKLADLFGCASKELTDLSPLKLSDF